MNVQRRPEPAALPPVRRAQPVQDAAGARRTNSPDQVRSVDTMRRRLGCGEMRVTTTTGDPRCPPAPPTFDADRSDRGARRQPARRPEPPAGRGGARPTGPAGGRRARRRDREHARCHLRAARGARRSQRRRAGSRRQALRPPGVGATNPVYRRLVQAYLVETPAPCSMSSTRSSSTRRAASGPASRCRCSPRRPHRRTPCSATRARWPRRSRRGAAACSTARGTSAHDIRHNGGMPSTVDTRPVHRRRQPRGDPRARSCTAARCSS